MAEGQNTKVLEPQTAFGLGCGLGSEGNGKVRKDLKQRGVVISFVQ